MPPGDAVIADGQYEFTRANGSSILMGYDTDIRVIAVRGLIGMPEVRARDADRDGDHGAFYGGVETFVGRRVAMSVVIEDLSQSVELNLDDLHRVISAIGDEAPGQLVFKREGKVKRQLFCKPRRSEFDADWDVRQGFASGALEFYAADPRVYSLVENLGNTTLPTASGGRIYNRSYPLAYGTVSVGGQIIATNAGNFETPFRARIYGPVDNPTIRHATLDKELRFSISIASGDYLEVSSDEFSVLLNGTASRRITLDNDSDWFRLMPGDNEIRYLAQTFQTGSHLDFYWRSAWANA